MLRFCQKNKGAISVFLTLILLPTFIFGGVIIDGSRILGAKNLISGAGDLAMNGALSNYHEELNKTYGLLAMASTAEEVEDIMKDFFETTLNANGISEEDFSKALVYLELMNDDFQVSNIPGTQVYETEVLKQQILEYMKYRAPVTLVNRAIDGKLENLKNAEKERKAADTQLKFESELDDLQKLFDDLKELTDRQEEIYRDIYTEPELKDMLNRSKKDYQEITMLTTAYYRMMHCAEVKEGDTRALMEEMVGLICDVNQLKGNASLATKAETASKVIQMQIIINSMSRRDTDEILEGLDEESEEYREAERLISDYESAESLCTEGITNTGNRIDELVKAVYEEMNNQYDLAVEGEKNCQDIKKQVEKIKEKFEDLRGKYEDWKAAVNDLPDGGESKSSYQENIDEVSGFFEAEGDLADFTMKIDNNEKFYSGIHTQLINVTFTGYSLADTVNSKSIFLDEADYGQIKWASEIQSKGTEFMTRYHDIELQLAVENMDISDDKFIKKVKEFYCKSDDGNESKSKEETEKWDSELESLLTQLSELMLTTDLAQLNVDTLGQNDLPSDWLNSSTYGGEDDDSQVKVKGGLKDKNSRKEVSNSGSDNLNKDNSSISQMSNLGDKIAQAGVQVAEPLLLTEYVMGMFSHYTSDEGGENPNPLSISRHDLSDNAIYRAEIEYILWGNPDIRTNVGATKAIIFALNLIFNMSFAFTNKDIKRDATTIANFFPVGPLARTAIKCALQAMVAMIETTRNMLDIVKGKEVPLVKKDNSWETWIITPGGQKSDSVSGFTYEDYLWVMVCVKMFIPSQQTELLARTADCIELNMTDKKSDMDNTLKDMYTMVDLEASVSIDTFFLQRLSGAGYDVQTIDEETFKIQYYGVQGY